MFLNVFLAAVVLCALVTDVTPLPPGRRCFYDSVLYEHGETMNDPCATCTCNNGSPSCSNRTCAPGYGTPLSPGSNS